MNEWEKSKRIQPSFSKIFLYQISETRLKTQNWMVLFPATGYNKLEL